MDSLFVESVEELHEVVDVHRSSALFPELDAVQDFVDQRLDVQVGVDRAVVERAVDLVVLLQHQVDGGLSERGAQSLVLPHEGDPGEAVPLTEVDRRWRVAGLDTDNTEIYIKYNLLVVKQ